MAANDLINLKFIHCHKKNEQSALFKAESEERIPCYNNNNNNNVCCTISYEKRECIFSRVLVNIKQTQLKRQTRR